MLTKTKPTHCCTHTKTIPQERHAVDEKQVGMQLITSDLSDKQCMNNMHVHDVAIELIDK